MRYMGSKARHAKHIVPIMMDGHDQSKPYIEPFVGGGNMMDKVPADIRWGSDVAEYAIALLDALSNGWIPPETLSFQEYESIKSAPDDYPKEIVGFAGHCCTFGGKLWGGCARNKPEEGDHSSIPPQQHRMLQKQAVGLMGVRFSVSSYLGLDVPDGSTVYMDPPYAGTTKYKSGGFDHDVFWEYCDDLSKRCRVFVSEYTAPDNWHSVWEKDVASSLTKDTGSKRNIEKLFMINLTT